MYHDDIYYNLYNSSAKVPVYLNHKEHLHPHLLLVFNPHAGIGIDLK